MFAGLVVIILVNVVLSFPLNTLDHRKYIPRLQSQRNDGRNLHYDIFEDDPNVIKEISNEMAVIENTQVSDIRKELSQRKIFHEDVYDKIELIKMLAKAKVKSNIVERGEKVQIQKSKQLKAEMITRELEKVQKLAVDQIQLELKRRGIIFDAVCSKSELATQLALARLNILKSGNKTSYDPSAIQIAAQSVKNIVKSFSDSPVRILSPDSVMNFTENIFLDSAVEKRARSLLNEKRHDPSIYEHDNATKLVESSLREIQYLSDFDTIKSWAQEKPRALIVSMLSYLNEKVPEYSSKSTLSALLADTIMLRRNLNLRPVVNTNRGDHHPTGTLHDSDLVGNSASYDRGGDLLPTAPPISFASGHEGAPPVIFEDSDYASAHRRNFSYSNAVNVKKGPFPHRLSPEASLWKQFLNKISTSIPTQVPFGDETPAHPPHHLSPGGVLNTTSSLLVYQLDRLALLGLHALTHLWKSFRETEFGANLLRMVNSTMRQMMRICFNLARWSGGSVLDPAVVLFLASAVCLLGRRGVFSFLAVLVSIRLLRIAFRYVEEDRVVGPVQASSARPGKASVTDSGAEPLTDSVADGSSSPSPSAGGSDSATA